MPPPRVGGGGIALHRAARGNDADDALVVALGGPAARSVLDTGPAPVHRYWLPVWAARATAVLTADRA